MTDYYEGAIVRITGTFSFNVEEADQVFFEFDDQITQLGEDSLSINDLELFVDSVNNKKCFIDIDTFGKLGVHNYHFYTRGTYKAGVKGTFKVV